MTTSISNRSLQGPLLNPTFTSASDNAMTQNPINQQQKQHNSLRHLRNQHESTLSPKSQSKTFKKSIPHQLLTNQGSIDVNDVVDRISYEEEVALNLDVKNRRSSKVKTSTVPPLSSSSLTSAAASIQSIQAKSFFKFHHSKHHKRRQNSNVKKTFSESLFSDRKGLFFDSDKNKAKSKNDIYSNSNVNDKQPHILKRDEDDEIQFLESSFFDNCDVFDDGEKNGFEEEVETEKGETDIIENLSRQSTSLPDLVNFRLDVDYDEFDDPLEIQLENAKKKTSRYQSAPAPSIFVQRPSVCANVTQLQKIDSGLKSDPFQMGNSLDISEINQFRKRRTVSLSPSQLETLENSATVDSLVKKRVLKIKRRPTSMYCFGPSPIEESPSQFVVPIEDAKEFISHTPKRYSMQLQMEKDVLRAAARGYYDILTEILALDDELFYVNFANRYNGYTPLHYAASEGREQVVLLLLEHGGNVNILNKNGQTPLDLAIEQGHYQICDILEHHNEIEEEHVQQERENLDDSLTMDGTSLQNEPLFGLDTMNSNINLSAPYSLIVTVKARTFKMGPFYDKHTEYIITCGQITSNGYKTFSVARRFKQFFKFYEELLHLFPQLDKDTVTELRRLKPEKNLIGLFRLNTINNRETTFQKLIILAANHPILNPVLVSFLVTHSFTTDEDEEKDR